MSFLYWLEAHRCAFFDGFFSVITYLGDEIGFMLIALLFYWCIDKRDAYYLFAVGFFGTIVNQCVKISARISRPWIKDPSFSVVGNAKEAAGGYSFPSGHTQNAVGTLGGAAMLSRPLWLKITLPILALLVALSRMYLGVHTPADVLFSLGFAVVLVFALYPLFKKARENYKLMNIILGVFTLMTVVAVIYVLVLDGDGLVGSSLEEFNENLTSARKNIAKMLGCALGLWLVYNLDEKYVHFSEKATLPAQIVKMLLGILILLAIKEGVKLIIGTSLVANAIRYFLIVAVAGIVYPLLFPHIQRLCDKIFSKKSNKTE